MGFPFDDEPTVNSQDGLAVATSGSPNLRRRSPASSRRGNTDGSLTGRTTRAEMRDPALRWFNPPSAPSDYRSDHIGLSEFPICRVDESDRESDILSREGN